MDDGHYYLPSGNLPPDAAILPPGIAKVTHRDPRAVSANWLGLWESWTQLAFATHKAAVSIMAGYGKMTREIFLEQYRVTREAFLAQSGIDIQQGPDAYLKLVDANLLAWLEREAKDGDSPGKTAYLKIKTILARHYETMDALNRQIEQLPLPLRAWFEAQLMLNQYIADIWEEHGAAAAFKAIGDRLPGQGKLYTFNGQFIAEDAQGQITTVDANALAAQFAKGAPRPFPRVVITSSHAQGESLEDASMIMHGIEAMARDCKQPLTLGKANMPMQPHETLIMMACDTERNPPLNAAALGERLNELSAASEDHPDRFKEISPGAPRIARFILRCMAEEQSQVNIGDPRRLVEQRAGANQPLVLQADAADIARHLTLWGYSKGGNVVSDAMRYLVSELQSTDAQGRPVILLDANRAMDDPAEVKARHELISSIKLIAVAAREKSLTPQLKRAGVRRMAFNNHWDPIIKDSDYISTPGDEKITVNGGTARGMDAHRPDLAMGTREAEGFFIKDPRIKIWCEQIFDPACPKISFERGR